VPATRRAIQSRHRSAFPWGTFTVNVVGSFILGVLVAITDQLDPAVAAGVGIGFCGALTTYSTFSYETLRLLEKRAGSYAVANIVASVAASFAAAGIGLALAPAPHRFSVGEFAAKVHARTGTSDAEYTICQAAYDLRKLRGKTTRRQARTDAPPQGSSAGRTRHRRADQPPPPGHRTYSRRHPQPTDGPKTQGLDQHRPRLRTDPRQHAGRPSSTTWPSRPRCR
jgi:CrcB protein